MKLIILYGPPAVGKFTVAKELASLTGYKLFHNHLTVDLVTSLFEYGTPPFWKLLRSTREQMLEAAAREGVNLIFTFVFAAGEDEGLMNGYFDIIEKNGGEVSLVQLKTTDAELSKRVENVSRKAFGKIATIESLESYLKKYDLRTPVPGKESLIIDNTDLTPLEVAEQIRTHFSL